MPTAARLACAWLLAAAACAAPNSELNLAPLFARHTLPGWESAEALGGALRYERDDAAATWAASPLLWRRQHSDGRAEADFLFALGRRFHDPQRPVTQTRLFPLGWHRSEVRPDGVRDDDWSLLFWLLGGGTSADGEDYFWFFPFGGRGEDLLSYDEFEFVLWPLWLRSRKDGRTATHVLWPLFGWQTGTETGWRIFPLHGRAAVPGKYERSFWLWPFLHFAHDAQDQREPRRGWLALLIGGRVDQGDFAARSVLWPFFQWERQPSRDFRSWTAFWPLLKFARQGGDEPRELQRVLPFWLHYEDRATEFASSPWPLCWWRRDQLQDGGEREAWYALPFFFAQRSAWDDGTASATTRFWPLASARRERGGSAQVRILDPGLPPVLDPEVASRNFGFLYEVWSRRTAPPEAAVTRRDRGWLGLWHAAEGGGHRRSSLAGLGGRWTEPDGTAHTALLFGLLRWRRGPEGGFEFEAPAFPGPGWPELRAAPPPGPTEPRP
jgi:hypothetical protein